MPAMLNLDVGECPHLYAGFEEAEYGSWDYQLRVYSWGVFLVVENDDNRQAEVEYELKTMEGESL